MSPVMSAKKARPSDQGSDEVGFVVLSSLLCSVETIMSCLPCADCTLKYTVCQRFSQSLRFHDYTEQCHAGHTHLDCLYLSTHHEVT